MTQIIAIAGKKQAGKNTAANFLHGHVLKLNEVIKDYRIDDKGLLYVDTQYIDRSGEVQQENGLLDLTSLDPQFAGWASQKMWPHIKLYSFADALKEICVSLFGLTYEQAYGSYKNSATKLLWEKMPGVITPEKAEELAYTLSGERSRFAVREATEKEDIENLSKLFDGIAIVHKPGRMTAREVLQFVGTEVFRKMYEPVWTELLMNTIKLENPRIAVISDCRFANEAQAVKEKGGRVILLTRNTEKDTHISEDGFGDWNEFDLTIDNSKLKIKETHEALLNYLTGIGISEFIEKA
jgi:hypothetical protein